MPRICFSSHDTLFEFGHATTTMPETMWAQGTPAPAHIDHANSYGANNQAQGVLAHNEKEGPCHEASIMGLEAHYNPVDHVMIFVVES